MNNENVFFSMTGYGRVQESNAQVQVCVEIKSLNQRFKEIKWRLPSLINSLEITGRKIIDQYFRRGSFDISIMIKFLNMGSPQLIVDKEKVHQYLDQFRDLKTVASQSVDLGAFLRPEFAAALDNQQFEQVSAFVMSVLDKACVALKENRSVEGVKLKAYLQLYLQNLAENMSKIKKFQQESVENKKAKIMAKIDELGKEMVDQQRLAQELLYWSQRVDIQEELDRFDAHCQKIDSLLNKNSHGEVGKELEFLLQELQRETNTLSNKADHSQISHLCVDIKVLIEKMREQVLNIE